MNSNLLSLKFWFNLRPGRLLPVYEKSLLIFGGIMLLAALFFFFLEKRYRKTIYSRFFSSLFSFAWVNLLVISFLLFFNYELVPFLSSRFWFFFWLAEMAVWFFFLLKSLTKIPERKRKLEEEKAFKKYLP